MKETNDSSTEKIHDHDVVERFVYAFNGNTNSPWILHFNLQFIRFEKLIFELIDLGFVNIKELDLDEFAKLSLANYNSYFKLDSITGYEVFMKALAKRSVEL